MPVWALSFVVLFGLFFGIAELYPLFRGLSLPSPVFLAAGVLLAIASNAHKPAGLPWRSSSPSADPLPTPAANLNSASSTPVTAPAQPVTTPSATPIKSPAKAKQPAKETQSAKTKQPAKVKSAAKPKPSQANSQPISFTITRPQSHVSTPRDNPPASS